MSSTLFSEEISSNTLGEIGDHMSEGIDRIESPSKSPLQQILKGYKSSTPASSSATAVHMNQWEGDKEQQVHYGSAIEDGEFNFSRPRVIEELEASPIRFKGRKFVE